MSSLMVNNFRGCRLGNFQRLSPQSTKLCGLVERLMVCLKYRTELCNFGVVRHYRDNLGQILHFTGEETKPRDTKIVCLILSHG